MGHAKLIGDLHVFQHVLDGKVRPKIVLDHFGHSLPESWNSWRCPLHGFDEPVEWQTRSSDQCQGFRRCLTLAAVTMLVAILIAVAWPISLILIICLPLASRTGRASHSAHHFRPRNKPVRLFRAILLPVNGARQRALRRSTILSRQHALNRARQWNAQLRCAAIRFSPKRSTVSSNASSSETKICKKSQSSPVPLANRQNLEQDAVSGSTRKPEIFLAQIRAHRPADNSEADYSNNFRLGRTYEVKRPGDGRYFVKIKLRAKTPGGNAEGCEFQGSSTSSGLPPVRRSFSEGGSPSPTF